MSTEAVFTSGNGFTPGITEFVAGNYYIGAIDQSDCKSNVIAVEIDQNPELIISNVDTNGPNCYGATSGKINIQANGGQ